MTRGLCGIFVGECAHFGHTCASINETKVTRQNHLLDMKFSRAPRHRAPASSKPRHLVKFLIRGIASHEEALSTFSLGRGSLIEP